MPMVYFETLNQTGSRDPRLVPRENIRIVRPLTKREAEFAERLGSGYFDEVVGDRSQPFETVSIDTEKAAGRELKAATIRKTTVPHADTRAILEMTDGERFFLANSVRELAAMQSDLISLGQPPHENPGRPAQVRSHGATEEAQTPEAGS